jgi:hypothetical protein
MNIWEDEMVAGEQKRLPLAEMIAHVADEVTRANDAAVGRDRAVMRFSECEITVAFELDLELGGKVNLWAVELGTKGTQSTVHTLTVRYQSIKGLDYHGVV